MLGDHGGERSQAAAIRVAVLGAGGMGLFHAGNVARGVGGLELARVADPDAKARHRAEELLGVPTDADWRSAIEDPSVDAVLVCSTSSVHAEQIVAACEAGKHVFCEKPLATTLEGCDAAIAAAASAGVVLFVGFNRRFDASVAHLHGQVRAGRIGRPLLLRITSRDPLPPPPEHVRSTGGMYVETTIHDFDMARHILGEDPDELMSYGAALVDGLAAEAGDLDTAVTTMTFGSGTIATIDNCRRSAYGYDQRIEVHGSEGSARTENVRPLAVTLEGEEGALVTPGAWFYRERYAASYAAELVALRAAIESGEAPVTGEDGKAALLLALAATCSQQLGAPVRLGGADET